ncbi:MAG TPA: cytosine permease [Ktedonobacteraceae bacterium]|nr:cytosine permease [Ktedonobacteraceae bacterium]
MASDTVAIPEEHGIETHGIERVSPETRTHVRIFDNFTMWLSANLVISTIALGALASQAFFLGFWDSLAVIIIFNALGVLAPAIFSTLGPRLGLRQMTIARFSFGWVGGIIMAFFNVAACIGWSTVNVIVGGQLVTALACGAATPAKCTVNILGTSMSGLLLQALAILLIAVLTTLVSIYGYRYVHHYERFAWIPMAIIFAIVTGVMIVNGQHLIAPTPVMNATEIASLVSFGGAVYGFATGWTSYAADYNVNQPENAGVARIFWLTFLGIFIPCVLLETLGMLLANWLGENVVGGQLLAVALEPLGSFGKVLVFLLAMSIIANNIPNDYSLGLSVQVFGHTWQRIPRYVWTLIGAVIYVAFAVSIATLGSFNDTLSSFLLLVAYWLGPLAIIMIMEHFVFRHGRYNVEDWNNPRRLPVGWAAIVSMVLGLFGAFLGFAQVFVYNGVSHPITGVIGGLLNKPYGMDTGFELGIIFSLISYLILRPIELRAERARPVAQAEESD